MVQKTTHYNTAYGSVHTTKEAAIEAEKVESLTHFLYTKMGEIDRFRSADDILSEVSKIMVGNYQIIVSLIHEVENQQIEGELINKVDVQHIEGGIYKIKANFYE